MINLEKHLSINPYSLDIESKNKFFSKQMAKLIRYHFKKCKEYKNILTNINYDLDKCIKKTHHSNTNCKCKLLKNTRLGYYLNYLEVLKKI